MVIKFPMDSFELVSRRRVSFVRVYESVYGTLVLQSDYDSKKDILRRY